MAGSLPLGPGKWAELRDTRGDSRAGPHIRLVLQAEARPAFAQTLGSARWDSRAPARRASPSPLLSLTAVTVTFVKHKRNHVTCPRILQRVSKGLQKKFRLFALAFKLNEELGLAYLSSLSPVSSH